MDVQLLVGMMGLVGVLVGSAVAGAVTYFGSRIQARSTNENPLVVEKLRIYSKLAKEVTILVGDYGYPDGLGGHAFRPASDGRTDTDTFPKTIRGDIFIQQRFDEVELLAVEAQFLAKGELQNLFLQLRFAVRILYPFDEKQYTLETFLEDELRDARVAYVYDPANHELKEQEITHYVNSKKFVDEQNRKSLDRDGGGILNKTSGLMKKTENLQEIWPRLKLLMLEDIGS